MITQEQIEQYQVQISETFETQDRERLFELSQKLYKETDERYPYFLGACYLNGWGVEQSLAWALIYLHKAADNGDNRGYACYLAAIAHYRCNEFKDAYDWFCKAEEAGVTDSLALFADSAAGCALNLWDEVRNKFLPSEVSQGTELVKIYMFTAIDKYMQAGEEAPETMSTALWCGYAKMLILMYNLATTGMLDMDIVNYNYLGSVVSGGLNAMMKMMDTEAHDKTLEMCVIGAYFMEQHDAPLVAEYLRAYLALMESTRDRSADAFYRARWHMKRIGQMREQSDEAAFFSNVFSDLDGIYRTAEHKYGASAMNMMRAGQLPDLTKSFLPGYVPEVDSCANFMAMFTQVRRTAQQPAAQGTTEKVGGFLKNLFKR